MLTKTYTSRFKTFKDANDQPTGEIEFYASIYGNVDHIGDRVVAGAFDGSIKSWREKGESLPIIFSHQWDDPFAIIGEAAPGDIKSDSRGLLIKAKLDIDENPTAKQVYSLIKRGLVLESSFAYDVVKEKKNAKDQANDLIQLDLIEAGPTLKGMNPETRGTTAKIGLFAALLKDMSEEDRAGLIDEFKSYLKLEKAGRRNSGADQAALQQAHDALVGVGAMCSDGTAVVDAPTEFASRDKAHEEEEEAEAEGEDKPAESDEDEDKKGKPPWLEDKPEDDDKPESEDDEDEDKDKKGKPPWLEDKPDESEDKPASESDEDEDEEDKDKKSDTQGDDAKSEDAEAKDEKSEEPSEDAVALKRRADAELLDIEAFLLD